MKTEEILNRMKIEEMEVKRTKGEDGECRQKKKRRLVDERLPLKGLVR